MTVKTMLLSGIGALALVALIVLFFPRPPEHPVLRLYAGAGLRRAVDKLTAAFRAESGIRVEPDYGGSGVILSRAREDRDADLFLPGDGWYVERLQELGRDVAARTTVSYFVPTIIVAKGNPKGIRGLKDFARPGLRIALGRVDACQIGRVSAKLLKQAGVDLTRAKPRESLTVNELGVWVKMRAADAAVVWDAIAANIAEDVDCVPIPPGQNIISQVVLAQLASSSHPDAARRFAAFVTGPEGRRILTENGFRVESGHPAVAPPAQTQGDARQ